MSLVIACDKEESRLDPEFPPKDCHWLNCSIKRSTERRGETDELMQKENTTASYLNRAAPGRIDGGKRLTEIHWY